MFGVKIKWVLIKIKLSEMFMLFVLVFEAAMLLLPDAVVILGRFPKQ